jgi:hypothetical protein
MNSSWDETVSKSKYHFNRQVMDPRWDTVIGIGHIDPREWNDRLDEIIHSARPATWSTRGYKSETGFIPQDDLHTELFDLKRMGADPDMEISNLGWTLSPELQDITDRFALDSCMARIHVQWPGQVWTRHIDKLEKFDKKSPDSVARIMIQLTDWQPGHFWEFGNYTYKGWRAGDVITFDWQNVPHCTANAGHVPRATLQLTGIKTATTERYISFLKKSY